MIRKPPTKSPDKQNNRKTSMSFHFCSHPSQKSGQHIIYIYIYIHTVYWFSTKMIQKCSKISRPREQGRSRRDQQITEQPVALALQQIGDPDDEGHYQRTGLKSAAKGHPCRQSVATWGAQHKATWQVLRSAGQTQTTSVVIPLFTIQNRSLRRFACLAAGSLLQ